MPTPSTFDQLKKASPLISVGVLTADLMHLGSEIEILESLGFQLLHFDVMDGQFCPPLTFGPAFVKGVKTNLLKDVHLMINDPLDKLEGFVAAGADIITVNIESTRHIHRALQMLGKMENVNYSARGILRGVVLNPGTPVESVRPLLDDLEMVFLLAVNPGWSGQSFISQTKEKLLRLKQMIAEAGRDVLVGIDGGIKKDNIVEVASWDVDIIVAGSAIFDGKDLKANAEFMIEALKQ